MRPDEAEKKYRQVLQHMSVEQRLRIIFELHEMGKKLVRAGIQSLHPTWDLESIEAAVKERLYADSRRDSTAHSRPT